MQIPKYPDIVACDLMLKDSYLWVGEQRSERSHNNSLWDLRSKWSTVKLQLQHQLRQVI